MKRIVIAGAVSAALASPASAQVAPKAACTAIDAALPSDLAAWQGRGTPAKTRLNVGRAATVALRPVATVRYATPPEKPGAAGSFGGATSFDVHRAGTYRVSLSEGAWIDVVRGEKAVASTAHGHGPECSSIRKIVTFPLTPGRYTLQFSDSPKPAIAVLVTPAA